MGNVSKTGGEEETSMSDIKWAFSFLGKSKYKLYISWAFCIVFNFLVCLEPQIVKIIVNEILYPMFDDPSMATSEVMKKLWPLCIAGFSILVTRCLVRFISNIFREQASQQATYEIRNALYKKLTEQSRRFLMKNRSGDLINICTGDVEVINHFISWVSWSMFDSIVMLVTVLVVFFTISWKFTVIELCLAPFAMLAAFKLARSVRPIFRAARQQLSRLNTVVSENIAGNRVVRAFCREPFEMEKFTRENDKYYAMNLDANKKWTDYSPIMETIGNTMGGVAIIIGALLVIAGDITVGDLVVFTSLSWMINSPFQNLGFLVNDWSRFSVSCDRVRELYYSRPDIVTPQDAVPNQPIKGDIDLEHVSISYDGVPVLKDVTMHIPAGTTVGIMGPTGSGKSTILNLISRFEDPQSGHVKVDGIDVQRYNLQHLRRNVATALQDVFLFSDTVESNIVYGVPDADMDTVYQSAKDAAADEFIRKLPDQYDTIVGERGMGLSGGQKQRLSLARALAMNAPILILDDTTSAVDMETEHYIQERLRARQKKATTLIVAQRISSVKQADMIFIIQDGRVTECGTHQQLLEKKGYYYNIYRIQQGIATEEDLQKARQAIAFSTARKAGEV